MRYAKFLNRAIAGVIDYIIVTWILSILGFLIFYYFTPNNGQGIMIGGALIVAVPLLSILTMIYNYDTFIFILILIFFVTEVLYYSLQELYGKKRTLGFLVCGIRVDYQDEKNRVGRILLRNSLKTLSRYLYGLPFLTMFFSEKRQAVYDTVSGAVVYEVKES